MINLKKMLKLEKLINNKIYVKLNEKIKKKLFKK